MAQPSRLTFQCFNPECKRKIDLNIPAKSGIYTITCPYCGNKKKLRIKGLDDLLQPTPQIIDQTAAPDNSKNEPIRLNQEFTVGLKYNILCPQCNKMEIPIKPTQLGIGRIKCPNCKGVTIIKIKSQSVTTPDANSTTPDEKSQLNSSAKLSDNSAKQPIDLGDEFYISKSYTIKCPHCEKEELTLLQDTPGVGMAVCNKCKGRIKFSCRNPTISINKSASIQRYKGKLTLLRRGWINKDFQLHDGVNTVGRFDENKQSDIPIKGDASMSRQSIEIEVIQQEKGYSFKLTVKKSTNPVLHNNKPLPVGDSISLNFGDSIILGKTKFRFDKDV